MLTLLAIAPIAVFSVAGEWAMPEATAPAELIDMVRQVDPSLVNFRKFASIPINSNLAIWSIFASPAPSESTDDVTYPETVTVLCVVIAENERPVLLLDRLLTEWRPRKGYLNLAGYHLDSLSDTQVTFLQDDGFYGIWQKKLKISFNVTERKVLGRQEFGFLPVRAVAVHEGTVWAAATFTAAAPSNQNKSLGCLLRWALPIAENKPELLQEVNEQPIPVFEHVIRRGGELAFEGLEQRWILRDGRWLVEPKDVNATTLKVILPEPGWPGEARQVELRLKDAFAADALPEGHRAIVAPGGIVVVDAEGTPAAYPMKNFEPEVFRRKRQDIIRNASPGFDFTLQNFIGPWQLVDGEIIFCTDFPDGEGLSGIGVIGHFGLKTRAYRFEFLDELAPWSTSALLVDGDTLWIATKDEPEGKSYSGGILRYNRVDKSVKRYPLPHVALALARHEDMLLIGTEDGLYIHDVRDETKLLRAGATLTLDGTPTAYRATVPQPDRTKHPAYSLEY